MSYTVWRAILQQLGGLARPPDGGLTDGQLLLRWLASRDEAAFELLIWRHGPTVLGVCQRLLRRSQDVEDAFQATFLVFLRKAGTIGKREAVASWLYKVAYRVALQARQQSARQQRLAGQEDTIPAPRLADAVVWSDVRLVLDEEVSRLPGRYRMVFVLCYLQDRTNEEAAREMGVPVGTVQSRLARARARLRTRLIRRGITLTEGALAASWAAEASARVPVSLVSSALKAGLLGTVEKAAAAGVVTTQATAFAKGALHAMYLTKLKTTAALILTVAVLGGGSAFTYRTLAAGPGDGPKRVARADGSTEAKKGIDKNDQKNPDPLQAMKIENERLKALLQKTQAQAEVAQFEILTQRKMLDKIKTENAALTSRLKELEAKQAGTGSASDAVQEIPPATVQELKDAIEILEAQLQIKKAELQGVMVDVRSAQRNLSHYKALAEKRVISNEKALAEKRVISNEEVLAAEEKVARSNAAVLVKEAELAEQQVRIRQAKRRLERLPGGPAPPRAAPTGTEKQWKEIRKDLELLLRKIDAMEKSARPPAQDGPRP